jgi:hypothetical protein
MPLTRDQALAALGLSATPDADAAAVQKAFERLARRYPQPSFPARFRELLEARDQLLDPMRSWRELLEGRTLDLSWILARVSAAPPAPAMDRKAFLQSMFREGYRADPLSPAFDPFVSAILGDDDDGDDDEDEPFL